MYNGHDERQGGGVDGVDEHSLCGGQGRRRSGCVRGGSVKSSVRRETTGCRQVNIPIKRLVPHAAQTSLQWGRSNTPIQAGPYLKQYIQAGPGVDVGLGNGGQ